MEFAARTMLAKEVDDPDLHVALEIDEAGSSRRSS
jgi:hypothetical protein